MSRATGFGLRIGTWLCIATALFAVGCVQDAAAPVSLEPESATVEVVEQSVVVAPVVEPAVEARSPDVVSSPIPASKDGSASGPLDATCTVDADCEVKDVGNCCGRMPACVNRSARPDPVAVQRECERTGTSSICGFQELAGCRCDAGHCAGVPSASGGGEVR